MDSNDFYLIDITRVHYLIVDMSEETTALKHKSICDHMKFTKNIINLTPKVVKGLINKKIHL
jgi:hypothetical protein